MITAAMFKMIEEAGEGVLVLADGLDEPDFTRSRLTRTELRRQLALMTDTLGALPDALRRAMPEIAWDGWRQVGIDLGAAPPAGDGTAWFAVRSLVPATLAWLRVYRKADPTWFEFTSPPPSTMH